MTTRILIIDDNDELRSSLSEYLALKKFIVDELDTGAKALSMLKDDCPDLIILDIGLPDIDGFDICRIIRKRGNTTPVIMLTARDEISDRVTGLECGADDYIVKPFSMRELVARIEAVLRRVKKNTVKELKIRDLVLFSDRPEAERNGMRVHLTPSCYRLLRCLMEKSPQVVSRQELEEAVFGNDIPDSDSLRSMIWQLRNTLEKPFANTLIKTHPGFGWSLE